MPKLLTIKVRFKNHMVKPTNSISESADLVPLEVTEQVITQADDWKKEWNMYNSALQHINDSEGKPTGNFEDNDMVILLMHVADISNDMFDTLSDLFFITRME